jgi:ligand-binding SRPBCC domain-containing protein
MMRGWMAFIHGKRNPHDQIIGYQRLQEFLATLRNWQILLGDAAAARFRRIMHVVSQNPSTQLLERRQRISRPLSEVFAFFADATNLEAITPPWLSFKILTPLPISMREGTLIDYQIRLFSLPVRWQTIIEVWQPPHEFVDQQLRGPYACWHHTHRFAEIEGGVLMTDVVRYRVPWGPLGNLARVLFVRPWLDQIFDYRRRRIAELLPAADSAHA